MKDVIVGRRKSGWIKKWGNACINFELDTLCLPNKFATDSQYTGEIMQDHELKFRAYLATKGLKLTTPRKHILDAVFGLHEHFNAEELYNRIKLITNDVSIATIYRTIPLLVDAGLVQQALRSSGRDRYEHIYGHPKHIHWLCKACGAIVETDLNTLMGAVREQASLMGFRVQETEISIMGLCWKCIDNEKQI